MKIGYIKTSAKRYGGKIYEKLVMNVLSQRFNSETINLSPKRFKLGCFKALELFFGFLKLKRKKDFWIRDIVATVALSLDRTKGKNISLIYHIDLFNNSLFSRITFFFFKKLLYYNLKKVDAIVTISQYWEKHFLDKGYKNVYKIYNTLNLDKFNISEEEILEFKKKYNLQNKPIIYIGNCQKAKGVVDTYNALKDLDVYLVTSGQERVKIPALNLDLKYRDYLKLLKASSIVITMSKFKEGWCITAHEAMLLKTPVIGSGQGGMKELLEGGRQIICSNFNSLKEKVIFLLSNSEISYKMGEEGYNYVKNFNIEKFKQDWLELIKKLSNE